MLFTKRCPADFFQMLRCGMYSSSMPSPTEIVHQTTFAWTQHVNCVQIRRKVPGRAVASLLAPSFSHKRNTVTENCSGKLPSSRISPPYSQFPSHQPIHFKPAISEIFSTPTLTIFRPCFLRSTQDIFSAVRPGRALPPNESDTQPDIQPGVYRAKGDCPRKDFFLHGTRKKWIPRRRLSIGPAMCAGPTWRF